MESSKNSKSRMATVAVHAGDKAPKSVTSPKVPPIYAASVFTLDSLEQMDDINDGKIPGFVYSRISNPGIALLEETVTKLEGGVGAVAFGSGMAAITTSNLALLSAGDHVVSAEILYGGSHDFFTVDAPRRGIEATLVDICDLGKVRAAFRPNTKILYCETISNPLMEVVDLAALSEIAHSHRALLVVDNTFASPVLCRPLEHGADVSIHSATKYLNGHSDVTGGIAIGKDAALVETIRGLARTYGPVLSPFDAWLIVRGIRTLDLRVRKHSENALKLAEFLTVHPKVTVVNYPGLEMSRYKKMADKYLEGGAGGMLSFEVNGGLDGAKKVMESLSMVEFVPSLAGVATTLSHPGKTSHRSIPLEEREAYGVGDGLIRISVGIEDYRDIEDDFGQALEKV